MAVPLLNNGIIPDFVTTLDFRELNSDKLSPHLLKKTPFSLVAVISTSVPTARRLSLNHLFYCFQDNDTQQWLIDALKVQHQMKPAGTVASLSLSFAQIIGADPIIMVGHDFALTSENVDHVKGTVFNGNWHQAKNLITVKGINGKMVKTQAFLLEFKQTFEQIMQNFSCRYINATAAGAHIEGTIAQDFENVLKTDLMKRINVNTIVASALEKRPCVPLSKFLKAAHDQLRETKIRLKQVNSIIATNEKIVRFLDKKSAPLSKKIDSFVKLPQQVQKHKKNILQTQSRLKPFMPIEEVAAKMINEARTVQEIEKTNTFLEAMAKDAKIVALEMGGHQKGLTAFSEEVGTLVSFLEQEDKLISDLNFKDGFSIPKALKLTELYLKAMCPVKAMAVLKQVLSMENILASNAELGTAKVFMGIAKAQLLDFEAAERWWKEAVELDISNAEKISKQRRILGDYWEQRLEDSEHAVIRYVTFALSACREKDFALKVKEKGWTKCIKFFQDLKENSNNFKLLEVFLNLWEPVRDETPEWHYWKAKLMAEKDDKVAALTYLQDNLLGAGSYTKEFEYPSWLTFSARLLMETDQFDQGVSRLKQAVALDPEQALLWEELGDTFFEHTDFASAAVAYENCFLALPEKMDVLKKFGDCYLKQGCEDAAKEAYLAVLKKDPSNESARTALSQLEKR